ncbi:hypothetical protein IQ07DRAFT_523885, partial [Pyrenochaeta sp. DS3sAY3a]
GPTVFPILFAAVLGRASHAVLTWRLAKGEKIGVLDLLAGSTSLTSTVTSQFQLRTFSFMSIALVAIWCLSPIGGQASVRLMSTGVKETKATTSHWYMVNSGYFGSYASGENGMHGMMTAGVLFVAALTGSAATKSSPLDLWGNIKIPRIEAYELEPPQDDEGWYTTEQGDSDRYASLVDILPLRIKYAPYYESDITLECNVTSTYIETEVYCPNVMSCASVKVRRSKLDHFPRSWTQLDLSIRSPRLLMSGMFRMFAGGKFRFPTTFDRYLSDPNLARQDFYNVSQTSKENYTVRLAQLFNTYLACLNGFWAITSGINNETAFYGDGNQTFTITPDESSTKVERKEVIIAHRGWSTVLILSSILLILLSILNPIIYQSHASRLDIAMNISSLATRNNPYISIPNTGTFLDSADRAKRLQKVKVRFGDTKGTFPVGSLAIGSLDYNKSARVIEVQKGRLYK